MREIDLEQEKTKIIEFIRNYVTKAGKNKVVLGLSGGIDSSVIAALSAEALGSSNVHAIILPFRTTKTANVHDALNLAEKLQINHEMISITQLVDYYFSEYEPDASLIRRGNFMARIRMCILYDFSAAHDALVVGTGNRSELLIGYTTQFGDNACAFEPIGHLYKTEVRQLAAHLKLDKRLIEKAPSADLWNGQTDEDEIGLSYDILDEILYLLFDKNAAPEDIVLQGFSENDVRKVLNLYRNSTFKRRMPQLMDEED
ncbi:MAG: NAD+ synthase [Candidatus Cloacimonetes bacterium]|nr:NAD+ synthase [Candidatus Cloacimonadota bacterium]